MFGRKQLEETNARADTAELNLMMAEMRLAKYDDLIRKLKQHDHFRFNSRGGIIAYSRDEPEMFGTGYSVPDDRFRCEFVAA